MRSAPGPRRRPAPRDLLVGVTWIGETAAYLVGSSIGRHLLAPVLSPRKTLEGAAAQVIASIAAGLGSGVGSSPPAARGRRRRGALLGMIGQVGDLAESAIKRSIGTKDAGELIPGSRRHARSDRRIALQRSRALLLLVVRMVPTMKQITLLGATGSIGLRTLDLRVELSEEFRWRAWRRAGRTSSGSPTCARSTRRVSLRCSSRSSRPACPASPGAAARAPGRPRGARRPVAGREGRHRRLGARRGRGAAPDHGRRSRPGGPSPSPTRRRWSWPADS